MKQEWEGLIVGVDRYPSSTGLQDLTAAKKDAQAVAQQLENYGYEAFRLQCLPRELLQKGEGGNDSRGIVRLEELKNHIANLFNPPPPNEPPETALFFFSGHGWRQVVDNQEEVFLATSDVLPQPGDYGYSIKELGKQLQTSRAKRVIVWLDCCYSGELLNYIPTDKDYCLITATRSYEQGEEIAHKDGLLTRWLLEGLNPENYPDGIVNSHKLTDFIEKRMSMTAQRPLFENSKRAILLTTKFPKKRFENTCPYRSLSYFSETQADADVFYGRSDLIGQLLERVKKNDRLIGVLGASGSGKSSLLRAGLLYQLKLGQAIPGSDKWTYIQPFTPRENPLENLQKAFIGESNQSIMLIDQFEECFTMCDEQMRRAFFDRLIELIDTEDSLSVIIGMRSDFRGRLREYPHLVSKIDKPYVNVEHLNRKEIEEAIVKPADWVGLGIEEGLKQQLINDVEDYPGSLPLLQYTLTELWNETQKQGERFLRLETYQQLGGIEGTLQKRADQVFEHLSDEEQKVAQRIFLELTQIGDTFDTPRRVCLDELVNSKHSLELLDRVTEKLASPENRLITRMEQETEQENIKSPIVLDVVHEALIRHWKQLQEWRKKYQGAMVVERKIEAAAQEWEERGKPNDPGVLWQGGKLSEAENYLNEYGKLEMLDGVAEEFIKASQEWRDRLRQQQEEETKRKRRFRRGISVALLALTGFSLYQWQQAQYRSVLALSQSAESTFISNQNSLNSLVEALKAKKELQWLINKTDAQKKVLAALQLTEEGEGKFREKNRLEGHKKAVTSVAFSPDGKTIATASGDGEVILWNQDGSKRERLKEHTNLVRSVSFSPDSQILATADFGGIVKFWNLTQKNSVPTTIKTDQNLINSVNFSPDGQIIATVGRDENKKIILWSRDGKELRTLTGHKAEVWTVKFNHDKTNPIIATAGFDKKAILWNTKGDILEELPHEQKQVRDVVFSPDDRFIVTASQDKNHQPVIKVWQVDFNRKTPEKPLQTFNAHENYISAINFSHDGKFLAFTGGDQTVRIWRWNWKPGMQKPEIIDYQMLSGHTSEINSLSFSSDNQTLITGSRDKTAKIWQRNQGTSVDKNQLTKAIFIPKSQFIATSGDDNKIRLWQYDENSLDLVWEREGNKGFKTEFKSISFDTNQQIIAIASTVGTVQRWNIKGEKINPLLIVNAPTKEKPCDNSNDCFVWDVSFSSNGKLASVGVNGTIKVWDSQDNLLLETHEKIDEKLESDVARSVSFNADGTMMAVALRESKRVQIWNFENPNQSKSIRIGTHEDLVTGVSFSPVAPIVASSSKDGIIKLWEKQGNEWKLIKTLDNDGRWVIAVNFSPDGKLLAAARDDGTVTIWSLQGEKWLTLKKDNAKIFSVDFSDDGKSLVAVDANGTMRLWNLSHITNLDYLEKQDCAWVKDYLHTLKSN